MNSFYELNYLEAFFASTQKMFYLSMFMIFVILIETIFSFNNLFPAFGIHFLTLVKAGKDLLLLLIFMLLILVGFSIWAHVTRGSNYSDFNTYQSSILFLFQYVFFFNDNFYDNFF